MTDQLDGQMNWSDQDTWFSKMFPAHFHREPQKEQTSKSSSRKSSASQNRMLPMFLCLTKGNGPSADASTMKWEDGLWLGKYTILNGGVYPSVGNDLLWLETSTDSPLATLYLTLNIGEKPREANPTKLSDILEEEADPKYSLSSKAWSGILRRSEKRGKALPPILKQALENQIEDKLHPQN